MRLSALKGIGDKTEKLFNRLSVYTTDDLLKLYPRRYDVFEAPVKVADIQHEGVYAISGVVVSSCELNTRGRYKVLSVYVADDDGGRIKLTWFNMPFLQSKLRPGYRYIFRGEAAFRGSLVFMEQPVLYGYDEYCAKMNTMQPVYPLTAGLTNNTVMKAVKQCLGIYKTTDWLTKNVVDINNLMPLEEAVRAIHFPADRNELAGARKRLVFDEFFTFTLAVRSAKNADIFAENHIVINKSDYSDRIIANLGYELTNAQKKVYDEMISDMSGPRPMNRLIQGDVGSGKTILAFLAMADTCAAGYQAALMAPTEVLARQHYEAFCEIINKNGLPLKCVLMVGSLGAAARRQAHDDAKSGIADIVIGTHAVISEDVEFAKLGLAITDEQHRFGVKQRVRLHKKGFLPHVAVMSATPIPRSLAIILYGDLDISIIDEKPSDRLPIKNCIVDDSYHPNAYRFISNELAKGHQAYVICAMAEEGEEEGETADVLNVVDYSKELKKQLGPDVTVCYLYGRMKPAEKNRIMERFAEGEIQVLVSTTVVEVGINVPNATVMMVENAERFGLAGLHQLRGRVGRGDAQSYCIFVSNTKNELTRKRLEILKESNDGFYIAEQDLKLRGPGDMLGVRQSGDFGFALGDIYADASTLKAAADTARIVLDDDPELEKAENAPIREKLTEYMNPGFEGLNL